MAAAAKRAGELETVVREIVLGRAGELETVVREIVRCSFPVVVTPSRVRNAVGTSMRFHPHFVFCSLLSCRTVDALLLLS